MKELKIANIKFDNPFFLAPLAGITDAPFRRICSNMGASLTCSEMVSAKGLYYNDKNTENLLTILDGEKVVSYQLFGHEPEILSFAVKKLEDRKNTFIDINMGCPVPKIVKNFEGSYLLKQVDLIYDIVKALVDSTNKPITVKMRSGFDDNSINYLDVARAVFSAGGSAITLHARTREAYYSGDANWAHIRDLKEHFPNNIIIGNGDVTRPELAFKMMSETGCDFVSIGRGSLGNPWLFKALDLAYERVKMDNRDIYQVYLESLKNSEIVIPGISLEEKKEMIINHINEEAKLKGDTTAVKEIRKHVGWYFKGEKGSAKLRGEINQIDDIKILREKIRCL